MCVVTEILVNQLDQIPFSLPWKETEKCIDEIHKDQKINIEPAVNMTYGSKAFMDDCCVSSPLRMENYLKFNIPDESLIAIPENDEDRVFFLHLGLLRRVLYSLKRANLLINIKKCDIWCQTKDQVFLGLEMFQNSIRVPAQTRQVLTTMDSPKNLKNCRQILGLVGFFRNLCPYIGIYSAFLFEKLKTGVQWTWTSSDEEKLRELLHRVSTAVNEGLLYILDLNLRKTLHGMSDFCKELNTSAFVLCVRFEEEGKVRVLPALVDSRKMAPSVADKASMIGELCAICASLSFSRSVIGSNPVVIYTDSISTCHLVKRRFSAQSAIDNQMVRRLLMLLAEYAVIIRFVPGKTLEYSADMLSRIKAERGESVDKLLDRTDKMADFVWADNILRPGIETESAKEFLKRTKLNCEALQRIEMAKGLDCHETEALFADTHLFSKNPKEGAVSSLDAVIEAESPEEVFKNPNVVPDYREEAFESATLPVTLDEVDRIPADKVEVKEVSQNADFLESTIPSNHSSGLTEYGLEKERKDLAVISRHKELRDTIVDPFDGLLDPKVASNAPDLVDHLYNVNAIRVYCGENELDLQTEPLFTDMEEVKKNLNKAHLSNEIRSKKKYYQAAQKRERNLRLIYDVVSGKIPSDHTDCELYKRTDKLFNTLICDIESVIIHEGLLFRIKFPAAGQSMRCCVILNESDAHRVVRRFHNLCHRGAYWSYVNLSRQIYCLSLLGVCKSVVRSCGFCCSNFYSKVAIKSRLTNIEMEPGCVFIDLAGPVRRRQGGVTGSDDAGMAYVLVCLNPVTWTHVFLFLESKRANLVWTTFLNGYLRYYNCCRIISDGGKEWEETKRETALLNISWRTTNSYSPQANLAEGGVKRFSKAFKMILNGDATLWRKRLAYMQIIVNQSLTHPVTKVSPSYSQGCGDNASFSGPAIVFADDRTKEERLDKNNPLVIMKEIMKVMQRHFQSYVTPTTDHLKTFGGLGIGPGTRVYYRCHAGLVKNCPGMKKIWPRYLSGVVVRLNGRTSAVIRSYRTDRLLTRHISDVFRHYDAKAGPEYGLLESIRREKEDEDVDFSDKVDEDKARTEMQKDTTTGEALDEVTPTTPTSVVSSPSDDKEETNEQKPRRSRRLQGQKPEFERMN